MFVFLLRQRDKNVKNRDKFDKILFQLFMNSMSNCKRLTIAKAFALTDYLSFSKELERWLEE